MLTRTVHEVIVFDHEITRQEHLKVQRYLRAKFMNPQLALRHRRFIHQLLVSFFAEWLPREQSNASWRVARRESTT